MPISKYKLALTVIVLLTVLLAYQYLVNKIDNHKKEDDLGVHSRHSTGSKIDRKSVV